MLSAQGSGGMEQRHKADSRLRRAWRETNRSLSQGRRNWRKTSKNLVSSWQRILTFIGGDRVIVDPALIYSPLPARSSYFFPTAITTNEFGNGWGRPRGFSGLGFCPVSTPPATPILSP